MRQDTLIRHIWDRHQFSVMARSRNLNERISAMVASDPPLVADALELMAKALASTPTRSGWHEALEQAWNRLSKVSSRAGYGRNEFVAACKKGRDEARRFLFEAAAACGDPMVVGSSLLDDAPQPGFAFYEKDGSWWQVREKNGRLSSLPLSGLLTRATSSARREAVLQGEGILRRVAGTVYPDPRFAPALRSKGIWNKSWPQVPTNH